jgi:hypothetical protein
LRHTVSQGTPEDAIQLVRASAIPHHSNAKTATVNKSCISSSNSERTGLHTGHLDGEFNDDCDIIEFTEPPSSIWEARASLPPGREQRINLSLTLRDLKTKAINATFCRPNVG